MKQLERLKHIYLLLSYEPQTIESIQSALKAQGAKVSNRQLYRDLEDVGQYFLKNDERLDQKHQEFNRKVYFINKTLLRKLSMIMTLTPILLAGLLFLLALKWEEGTR